MNSEKKECGHQCGASLSSLVNGYIYRHFLLPSSRWFCLNGDIIAESVTPMRGVKWVDIFLTVRKFIIIIATLRCD